MVKFGGMKSIKLIPAMTIIIFALCLAANLNDSKAYATEKVQLINAQDEFEDVWNMNTRAKGKVIVTRKDGKNVPIGDVLKNAKYDGTAFEPPISVSVCENSMTMRTMVEGVDYSLSYSNNTNAGTARIIITGMGNYEGTVTIPFTINKRTDSIYYYYEYGNDSIELGVGNDTGDLLTRNYTGSAITHDGIVAKTYRLTHYFDDSGVLWTNTTQTPDLTLTRNTDFKVTYHNNIEPGDAYFDLSPMGNYTGNLKTQTFRIVEGTSPSTNPTTSPTATTTTKPTTTPTKAQTTSATKKPTKATPVALKSCSIKMPTAVVYTGSLLKPKATVKYKTKTLSNGIDYSITYRYNKNVGTMMAALVGKGNYTGKVTKSIKINPDKATITSAKTKKFKKKRTKITIKAKSKCGASYYQLQLSKTKSFSSIMGRTVVPEKQKNKYIANAKLKKKKAYYIRIRAAKKVSGKTYYGPWSTPKKIKGK